MNNLSTPFADIWRPVDVQEQHDRDNPTTPEFHLGVRWEELNTYWARNPTLYRIPSEALACVATWNDGVTTIVEADASRKELARIYRIARKEWALRDGAQKIHLRAMSRGAR